MDLKVQTEMKPVPVICQTFALWMISKCFH